MSMILLATFANRHYDPEEFELVHCWDEYCVEGNVDGYEESRQEALDSWGDDLARWVTVQLELPDEAVKAVDSILTERFTIPLSGTIKIEEKQTDV